METKKSAKADLEPRKNLFLQIGLIISLSAALVAFEWKSPVKRHIELNPDQWIGVVEDAIPPTIQEPPKPTPAPITFTRIELVDDKIATEDYEMFNPETSQTEEIPEYIQPKVSAPLDEERIVESEPPFVSVEKMPEFPGGEDAFKKYLASSIEFPEAAKEIGLEGIVYLSFIIEKDGSVSTIRILRGISDEIDAIVVNSISRMPKWEPGIQQYKPVRVIFNMPVVFKLKG